MLTLHLNFFCSPHVFSMQNSPHHSPEISSRSADDDRIILMKSTWQQGQHCSDESPGGSLNVVPSGWTPGSENVQSFPSSDPIVPMLSQRPPHSIKVPATPHISTPSTVSTIHIPKSSIVSQFMTPADLHQTSLMHGS